jgi:hypothetical protein
MDLVFLGIVNLKLSLFRPVQHQKYLVGHTCVLFGVIFQLGINYFTCFFNSQNSK